MSSMMERLLAQAEELLWETVGPEQIEPNLEHALTLDTFDQMTWDSLNTTAKSIRKSTDDIAEHFGVPGERAFQDLFNLFYQADPRMAGAKEMLPEFAGNHRLLQDFYDSDEVAKLRGHTTLDEYYAGFAILEMEQQFRDALERMQQAAQQQQQAEQQRQEAQQNLQQAQQEAQGAQDGDDEDAQEQAAQKLQEALDAMQQAQGQADQAGHSMEATADQVAQDMIHAARKTQDEIDKTEEACRTYGLGPGDMQRMHFDERRELSKKLHQGKLARFAKLIGSYKVSARAMRRQRVKHVRGTAYDFEMGQDLTRLASTELDAMAMPELEETFWVRYAKHELLLKKERGTEKAGQGPILVLCDESGSMTSKLDKAGNTREAWSKAVSLALCEQAKKERRDFTYIGFDNWICGEHHFPRGHITLQKLVDFVEHFGGGGTDFMPPLNRAIEILTESERRNQDKADVVFITDGDGHMDESFPEEFKKLLHRLDARCFAIQVGSDHDAIRGRAKLEKLTDKILRIESLNANPEGVADLFRNI